MEKGENITKIDDHPKNGNAKFTFPPVGGTISLGFELTGYHASISYDLLTL
jgi:hypothetical protein